MKGLICVLAAACLAAAPGQANDGAAGVTKTASIVLRLRAAPDAAFPLFDPVNETRWDPRWQPRLLGDRIEEGLVFLVGDGDDRTTWMIDRYEPAAHRIAYVVTGRSTLTRIIIALRPVAGASEATVTYVRTALDAQAIPLVEHFAQHFPLEQHHWESAINAVLHKR
jgi:hypothetical protein